MCAKAQSWQKCKNNGRYVTCNVTSKKIGPASLGTDIDKEKNYTKSHTEHTLKSENCQQNKK